MMWFRVTVCLELCVLIWLTPTSEAPTLTYSIGPDHKLSMNIYKPRYVLNSIKVADDKKQTIDIPFKTHTVNISRNSGRMILRQSGIPKGIFHIHIQRKKNIIT